VRCDDYVRDLREVSAALSVRISRKLCHTTSMMSMRRMAVRTLAASARRVRCDEYVRDLRDVSDALSVRNSRKLCHTPSMMSMRVPYDEYDPDEEIGGQDAGGEYDGE
jgi:hypothetical protein